MDNGMNFGRVVTAMVTPFDKNLNVDYGKAKELAQFLLANGSDSLVVCGTTGEAPTLTVEEKLGLFRAVREAVGSDVKLIGGTGSNATASTITFSQQGMDVGLDALLIVTPYYNKPCQAGIQAHFEAVFEAVEAPVMIYNIPGRTSKEIEPKTLAKLAKHRNAVAVKQSLSLLDNVSELLWELETHGAQLDIYSGDDGNTLQYLALGAKGVVSVASHLVGSKLQQLIQAYESGDTTTARKHHVDLIALNRELFVTSNPVPLKRALSWTGQDVGGVRLPLVEANDEILEPLKQAMKRLNLC